MGKLVALKNVSDGTLEYLEQESGRLYADEQGANLLRVLSEVEFLRGADGPLLDKHKRRIHLSALASAAAEHDAAMRANQLGCDIPWQAVSASGRRSDQVAKPRNARAQNIFMRSADGKLVAMDLAVTDVHTAAALPNYAGGYHLAPGVADQVAPVIPVAKQSDVYNSWNTDTDFKRKIPNASAAGGDVPMVNPTLTSGSPTYIAEQYALGGFITTEVQANADVPLQPWQKLMQMVVDALRLEREIRVAGVVQTSSNWNSGLVTTLASGAQWDGGASADPILNLHNAEEASYMDIDGFVFSELVLHDFLRSPAVQKYVFAKSQVGALPSLDEISREFGLPPIYVGKMKYVTGGALAYVWGDHVVGLHRPPTMPPTSQMDIATAVTFRWTGGTAPDGTVTGGFLVRSYWDPKRGPRGATVVVVTHNDAEVQTSAYVGALILNCHR
jgi:hypothetical protein